MSIRVARLALFFACGALLWDSWAAYLRAAPQASEDHRKREHAKLYRYNTGKKLRELASKGTGEIVVETARSGGTLVLPRSAAHRLYPHPYLVDITHRADAIVIGVTRSSSSAVTEEGDFVFTDWGLEVEEVIKDNATEVIALGGEITVSRPGGAVVLNGRVVRGRDVSFDDFVASRRYLLFLKYIPQTKSYQAFFDQSFEVIGDSVRKMTPNSIHYPIGQGRNLDQFVGEVRDAMSTVP